MPDRFKLSDYLCLFLVFVLAVGARAAYLHWAVDDGKGKPAWRVQGENRGREPDGDRSLELKQLVENWREQGEFKAKAPLARQEEITAHVAPAYSWLLSRLSLEDLWIARWVQAGLGALTAVFYFLFARRAFGSRRVAVMAGIGAALYPFWILNTAELHDGVLATFALALVLTLGTRGSQAGGVLTSLVFGLSLAGMLLVRAAFLPFALAGLIWYLASCRKLRFGWLCALLACLGFATGINPWIIRNYQVFGEPVPVASSTFLHLWMGNCSLSDGGTLSPRHLQKSLPPERYNELLDEPNQARRYNMLAHDVIESVRSDPKRACDQRVLALLTFLLGKSYLLYSHHPLAELVQPLEWLDDYWLQTILVATLLVLFALAFLGWRLSMAWRQQSRLAALAVLWVPLPYILTHAEMLSGPRLPFDGVLLCLAAYALVGFERKKK